MKRIKSLVGQMTFAFYGLVGDVDYRSREKALDAYFAAVAAGQTSGERRKHLQAARCW